MIQKTTVTKNMLTKTRRTEVIDKYGVLFCQWILTITTCALKVGYKSNLLQSPTTLLDERQPIMEQINTQQIKSNKQTNKHATNKAWVAAQ